jgi:hypothetical protein
MFNKPIQAFIREQAPAGRLLMLAVCFVLAAVAVFVFFDTFDIRSGFGDGAGALFRFLVVQLGLIVLIAYLLFTVFAILVPEMLSWGGWISNLCQKVICPKLVIFTWVPAGEIRPPRFLSN